MCGTNSTLQEECYKYFLSKQRESFSLFFHSIRDYKIKAGMTQLVNVLSLRIDGVKYKYGKEYSPLDIF